REARWRADGLPHLRPQEGRLRLRLRSRHAAGARRTRRPRVPRVREWLPHDRRRRDVSAHVPPSRTSVPPSGTPSLPPPAPVKPKPIYERLVEFIDHIGEVSLLSVQTARSLFRRPLEIRSTMYQLESLGVRSMGIVATTSIFIGMVMTI